MHAKQRIQRVVIVLVAGATILAVTAVAGAGDVPSKPAALSVFIPGEAPAGVPPQGTQLLRVDPVLDPDSGAHIGTAVTRVVIAEVTDDDAVFILDCSVQLPEGTINFYGSESFSSLADGVAYSVVGGTGRYRGTRGVVNITGGQLEGKNGSLLAFDVTRR